MYYDVITWLFYIGLVVGLRLAVLTWDEALEKKLWYKWNCFIFIRSIQISNLKETEKKIKELQAACDEIKKEIMQRQMENKSLKEDLESNSRQNIQDKKEYEKLIDEMEKLKASFFLYC